MIQIRNLSKTFYLQNARRGFSLSIEELTIKKGEIVYVLGPNGSGKTTLLSLIQGTVTADGGEILIGDAKGRKSLNLAELEAHERAIYLGVVPQDSDEGLVNEMTIADHVLVSLLRTGSLPPLFPRRYSNTTIGEILRQFEIGFEYRLSESVGNLSSGERQLLTFCMATVIKPTVMLLDEFTSSLDPEMARKVLESVMAHLRLNNMTTMIVTHRHEVAIDHADRVIILDKGEIYCEITKGNIDFNEERLRAIFADLYVR